MESIMKGFGYFNKFDNLADITAKASEQPEIELIQFDDSEEDAINNVVCPVLGDDKYEPSANKQKAMGSAGNLPEELNELELEKEPQLGGIGGGLSMKRNLERHGLGEGCEEDDTGMEQAREQASQNRIEKNDTTKHPLDTVKNMIDEMFGAPFNKENIIDATKPTINVNLKAFAPTSQIKRGW